MIMIDKYNYEAFLLDFVEGNLSAEQAKALENFLKRHPEIDADIFLLDNVKLKPDLTSFDRKTHLKRDESIPELSKQDALLIGMLENSLTAEGKQAAEGLIQNNRDAAKAFAQYQNTKLQTDETLQYPDKNELKKKSSVFILSIRQVGEVAAVFVGILVSVFVYLNRFDNQYQPESFVSQANYISSDRDAITQPETLIAEFKTSNENSIAQVDSADTQTTMSPDDYFQIQHIPKLSPRNVKIKQQQFAPHLAYNPELQNNFNWKNMDITYIRKVSGNFDKLKFPKSKAELDKTMAQLEEKFNPITKLREAKEEVLAVNVNNLFRREK